MDVLYEYQDELIAQTDSNFYRNLFTTLNWNQRMFGITGLRGTGKTTMLLQYLKKLIKGEETALYVTADHPWFYENNLVDLARKFVKYGGKILLIDEIHKYPHWSRELKNIYDGLPDLQVIFTASSVLDILRGESDLSRRALTYELPGLSFREYLELVYHKRFPVISLEKLLTNPHELVFTVMDKIKPLPFFKEYLKQGYFPFITTEKTPAFHQKLNQVINTTMEIDLQTIKKYNYSNIFSIKKLLGIIAESAPFEPNISKIAQKLNLGRDTVKLYLNNLEKARLLNLITYPTKGIANLQKPDKIYLENTNLSYSLKTNPNTGTLRETFFLSQLRNAGYNIHLSKEGDFITDGKWTFEIGGPSKGQQQINNTPYAYRALDDTEYAYLNVIPLWAFGFLY
jgi:predicted AAA+ superfamily ATPase